MAILQNIKNVIANGHKEAIKYIVSLLKNSQDVKTPRELELEASRLIKKVNGGKKVLNPIYAQPDTKISSFAHNSNQESVYIDLKGLYKQTDLLSNLSVSQKDTLVDEYSKAKAAILKLINDARVFSIRNNNPEYDDIKLVNFNITNNNSKIKPTASVDPDSRLLKLPTVYTQRAHLVNRGVRTTDVTAEIIGGKTTYLSKQFPPSLAVDARPETFWAELVYADTPIVHEYNRYSPDQDGKSANTVYGPIVRLNLSFSGAEPINQIRILPFSNSPVKVLEITYKYSPTSSIRQAIPNFEIEESLDWIEYNFETVFTTDIEIVLAQESYIHSVLKIPKSILYATDIILRLNDYNNRLISENPSVEDFKSDGLDSIYSEAVKDLAAVLSQKDLDLSGINNGDFAGKIILSISEIMTKLGIDNSTIVEELSSLTKESLEAKSEIETINRFEYTIGAREIECNYNIYSPIGYYESPKFESQSTISNIKLEVDERHPTFQSVFGSFVKTSTEWEVEFGSDRKIPIYPSNKINGNYLKVEGELLQFDNSSFEALTRFKSFLLYALVRENDKILASNQDYQISWSASNNGRLAVIINKQIFDINKLYTIDYYADPSAASIDVLNTFNDKGLTAPEVFKNTSTNNSIKLANMPYVNFSIINSDNFNYELSLGGYRYNAPFSGYASGTVRVYPNWVDDNNVILTGLSGSYTVSGINTDFTTLSGTYLTDPYRYYIELNKIPELRYEVSALNGSGDITLNSIPTMWTGMIGREISSGYFSGDFTGSPPSGFVEVPYTINVVQKFGDTVYGFENVLYEPVSISIGGKKAINITAYQDLEQPAFNVANNTDADYQFIHDGKIIYFNQPITNSEIKANYRWLTEYVKVNCVLRSNKIISPTVTPQVNEYRLLLNTTIL